MLKRKVCVVTGTRAEYGLLRWLLDEIKSDPELELQTVVTGMHLSPEFGLTYREIEADGIEINAKVEMLLSSDTTIGMAKSIGLGVLGFADTFNFLKPDIVVLCGDRFEILAAAQTAFVSKIPIAHLYGGESTIGVVDEGMRHAITKMSQLHFVSTEAYRKRVIQLGELPEMVFNYGAPGLDNFEKLDPLEKSEVENFLGLQLASPTFLVTYHPTTLETSGSKNTIDVIFKVFDSFPDAKIIFTLANSDAGGRQINQKIRSYAASRPNHCRVFTSMGSYKYISTLRHVDVVIGNSSSGILEAPFLKKPTVNLGLRQIGRLKAASIIDANEDVDSIRVAISKALSPAFQASLKSVESLYGYGQSSGRIKEKLKTISLRDILVKRFYDL